MATKKPTGLSISRKDNVFTLSWKAGEKYNKGQAFESSTGFGWSKPVTLANGTRSKALTLSINSFYPKTSTKIKGVYMRVRGKKKKKWSAWTDKSFILSAPGAPTVSANPDESKANVCSFSWSLETKSDGGAWFVDIEYQTMLVADCNTNDGSSLSWTSTQAGWQTGTGIASSSKTITEDTDAIATGSHTRWFRVRSRGPAGDSAWRYAKRVYAKPFEAVITSTSSTITPAGGVQIYSEWSNASSAANPTDTMIAQYAKAVPDAGCKCPANVSWADINTTVRKDETNAISASVDGTLEKDQCLFVRVNTIHLNETSYGAPAVAMKGKLKDPSITNITTNQSTHKATITASNASDVPDSFLVVLYRTASNPSASAVVGIIPHGQTSVTVQCPDWSGETGFAFGIYAATGTYTRINRKDNVSSYSVDVILRSEGEVWNNGSVPSAPGNVKASQTSVQGTVRVIWDWSWPDATVAVLSWADHEDAWQSTNGPSEYTVDNTHASEWNISGLEAGKRWYVRVRLGAGSGEETTYGPWSDAAVVDLSSAPSVPSLRLSEGVIPVTGSVTAYWTFVSGDGTNQAYAELCEASISGSGITYGRVIAHTETAQHITLNAKDMGWVNGRTYYLCVKVVSASGRTSDRWSDPVPVRIAKPLNAVISSTNLVSKTITVDGQSRTVDALAAMPLTVKVTGAGAGGLTTIAVERAEDYHVDRPDETDFNGFEGETIALINQTGEAQVTFDKQALMGSLDDGAKYRIVATVQDGLGQSSTATKDFEVHWNHQAILPEATVTMEGSVALITPVAPSGIVTGDSVDIYRLSADRPEIIVKGADFGTTYVDPYPAIGEFGGHRIVFVSKDGDYITAEDELAWIDLTAEQGDSLDLKHGLIDFDGEQVNIFYDVRQSNSWEKDFKETVYLGGSVQGDWNKGIRMKSSVSMSTVTVIDQESMKAMRRLASYPGICHIRTLDGSSYACDIQVSEDRNYGQGTCRADYTLAVTRVDPEGFEGMTYDAWRDE